MAPTPPKPRKQPAAAAKKPARARKTEPDTAPKSETASPPETETTTDTASPAGGHKVVPPPPTHHTKTKTKTPNQNRSYPDWTAPKPDPALPDALNALLDNPRIRVRRPNTPIAADLKNKCVVYWCQRSQRGTDNHALNTAVTVANALKLPLVVYFAGIANFPHANLRHYAFLNQGLPDLAEDLAARNISFVFRRAPHESHTRLLKDVAAAFLIGDENPMRTPESWRANLAKQIDIPFWTVDADCIIPAALFPKAQYAAHTLRPRLYKHLPEFLVPFENPSADITWHPPAKLQQDDPAADMTHGWPGTGVPNFDRSVPPVESWHGGAHAALVRLKFFIEKVFPDYDTTRNKPDIDGTTRLSPWLHYGHISAQTIALAADEAAAANPALRATRDSLFNELIAWRELGVNFALRSPDTYDTPNCAENWARTTIAEHARDEREHVYTLAQLESAQTYDDLWNACQIQMVDHGWMHNYLRMYWAKKILEWTPDNATAFAHATYLNDKYFLDGRDPGGYMGIAWALAGKFDRAWNQHPIFGKIRYMSGPSTGRKFNSKRFITQMNDLRNNQKPSPAAPADVATSAV